MPTLTSPGVSVSVTDQSIYGAVQPTTVPLFIIATRSSKSTPDGANTALGTTEFNRLRLVGSQRELVQNYGNPTFVTSGGIPVHGDETNEYGLMAAHSFLGRGSRAYMLRCDVDLGGLLATTVEPTLPPKDNTYWINTSTVTSGLFRFDGITWNAVAFSVFTTTPTSIIGVDGDWGFDYTSMNGTMIYKFGGIWKPATAINIQSDFGASNLLHVAAATPVGAIANDFWYKTVASGGGVNLSLSRYRAVDGVFVTTPITRSIIPPTPNQGVVWENTADIAATANHPLYVGTGLSFIPLSVVVQSAQPVTNPATGTLWYDSTFTDLAMYIEGTDYGFGNQWVPIVTTTVSNPSGTQKVISASAPTAPQEGAIWVDISTSDKFDNYPVIMRMQSGTWVDITSGVKIQDTDPIATTVLNGTYWINNGESISKNTVKIYDPTFAPIKVTYNGTIYSVVAETGNFWRPAAGGVFGRKSVRAIVVQKLQETIAANNEIRAVDANYYQLISCPGYPELYDEMVTLNSDIGDVALVVADTPKFMVSKSIPVGREVTVPEWVSNARSARVTGEDGFVSAKSPYAAFYSPWAISTDLNGNNVMVPPSHMALRTIAYSDNVAHPWTPPAGTARGRVDNANSIGYLNNDSIFTVVDLTTPMRDVMYENSINPIMFKTNSGLVVFGQKTFAATATALDRINVARLISKMKYDMKRLMEPYLFEINDPKTRRSVQLTSERYLAGLRSLGALYDYAIRCDESNNSPANIDAHVLNVDVALKAAKSIEFIYIPITILSTAQSLPF